MKSIKGITPSFTTCVNPSLNIFVSRFGKTEVQLRQPRRKDSGRSRLAWADLSEKSKRRYRRANVDPQLYDMKWRCNLPLYRGAVPGWLPLVMEVDSTIVGFVDIMFKYGIDFQKFNILPTEKACAASIGILDRYQGLGFGMAFSYLSDEIGRHFNMDFICGTTFIKDGMYHTRIRDNWEVIREYNGMVDHRKRLK
jgi:hypothetical protein